MTKTHLQVFALAFALSAVGSAAGGAMLSGRPAKFPAGSIIVREKFGTLDEARPELLAVMVKRARGFNPKAGDWEFLTVDGALTKIQERQKKGSCLQCHASQSERDFVFPVPAAK